MTRPALLPLQADVVPVWISPAAAAATFGMSREAFRAKLRRSKLPDGVVRKWGRSVLLHRERLLAWVDAGGGERA
jgi:hypothetical protein